MKVYEEIAPDGYNFIYKQFYTQMFCQVQQNGEH